MKKLSLMIMPLMAVSFLASCKKDPVIKIGYQYEVKANYGLKPIASGTHDPAKGDLIIQFTPIAKEESNENYYAYPADENIYIQFDNCPEGEKKQWVSPAEDLPNIDEYCAYDNDAGKLTIKSTYIKSKISIVARASDYPLLDKLPWQEIKKISTSGLAEYIFYLGEEKTITVNNKDHKVHIIGFNQDYTKLPEPGEDPDPSKAIGITFEFMNVISDENGFSLATYWQDTNTTASSNYDYKNSSVRKALMGEGSAEHNWFRYYKDDDEKSKQFVSDSDPYHHKSVYGMLPEELTSVLATPSKYVNIYNSELATPGWEEQTVEDKLFLLSPYEMGYAHSHDEEHTEVYAYYSDASDIAKRIKHQVCGETDARTTPLEGISGSYIAPFPAKKSYAGYDNANQEKGTYAWLRSPFADTSVSSGPFVYLVDDSGGIAISYQNVNIPYLTAINLAPAFCI